MNTIILKKEFTVKDDKLNFIIIGINFPTKLEEFRFKTDYYIETNLNKETGYLYGYDEWQSFFLVIKYINSYMTDILKMYEVRFEDEALNDSEDVF